MAHTCASMGYKHQKGERPMGKKDGQKESNRKRRGRGEGGIYQRESDGLWVSSISLGYDAAGKRIRRTVYGKSKKEVKEKLLALQQDALNGLPVKPEKLTVDQHFQDWFAAKRAELRKSSYDNYLIYYNTHIKPAFGGLQVKDVDYRRINALYALLDEKGLSKRTVAYIAFILKSGLEDAVKKGIIPSNPVKLAARRKQEKREARVLNQEEVRLFLEAIAGERLENAFILALHTGLRPGEWLGLPWDAVDWEGKKITVRQSLVENSGKPYIGDVKTSAGRRTISLSETAMAALRNQKKKQLEMQLASGPGWQNENGLVFTNQKGGPLLRANIDKGDWCRILLKIAEAKQGRPLTRKEKQEPRKTIENVGLAGITFHTLRHTHASILIYQGVDIKTISRRLGHENIAFTLQVYGHLLPGQDEGAADQMENFTANYCSQTVANGTENSKNHGRVRKIGDRKTQ